MKSLFFPVLLCTTLFFTLNSCSSEPSVNGHLWANDQLNQGKPVTVTLNTTDTSLCGRLVGLDWNLRYSLNFFQASFVFAGKTATFVGNAPNAGYLFVNSGRDSIPARYTLSPLSIDATGFGVIAVESCGAASAPAKK